MRSLCLLFAGCALLAVAAVGVAGERVPALARFRLDDPHSPTFYVRYQDHTLWIARSFEGLKKAKPLRLLRTQTYHDTHDHLFYRDREYAPVEIAGPIGAFTSVRMDPVVTVLLDEKRGRPVGPEGDFDFTPTLHFLYRDKSGVTWDYVDSTAVRVLRTNLVEKTNLGEMPVLDPTLLTLDLEVNEGERGLSLDLTVNIGSGSHSPARDRPAATGERTRTQASWVTYPFQDLRRNGKVFPLRLTITDARGKVVHSAAGDIQKFAMHGGSESLTEFYDVRLPKGRYTVTATLGRTPFSGPLSTSQQVEVK